MNGYRGITKQTKIIGYDVCIVYVCMYVCIYIFVCIYIYICMYVYYVCICACKDVYNIHMRTYVHTYIIHAHIYKYNLYACMYARILCMYSCIHVWLYVCTCIHIRMYALIEMIMVVGKLSRRELYPTQNWGEIFPRGNLSGRKVSGGKVSSRNCPFPCSLYMYAGAYIP